MQLRIMSPAAARVDFKVPPAPRLETLEGKTIGLYDNMTGGAGVAVDRVAEHIGRRYSGVKFESYGGPRREGRPSRVEQGFSRRSVSAPIHRPQFSRRR